MLPTLDLETATQRTIQEQLEDELGIPLDDYKAVIKAEVDAFLLGMNPEEADLPASEPPPAKKPRQDAGHPSPAAANTAPSPPTAATANTDLLGGRTGPGDFIYSFPISKLRFAGVRTYKGKAMVDVREYFEKEGQQSAMMPGKKGLTFSPEQWAALSAGMMSVNDALERTDTAFYLDVGGSKRASVSLFSGKVMISLREHYEKDGVMLPGKKGISLPPDQWAKLCAVHDLLTQRLSALLPGGGVSGASASQQQQKSQQPSASTPSTATPNVAATTATTTTTTTTNATTPPSGTTGGGSADAVVSLPLTGLRRIEVVNKKGKAVVDVREFYLKDGVMSHTKKGLQLTPEQFQILKDSSHAVTAALIAENEGFEIILAPK